MKKCDCCSDKAYAQCCEPYHLGTKLPDTPEALMRSRYSAYSLANIDYIQSTMRGKASLGFEPVTEKLWPERVIWIKLRVLAATQLSPTQGQVEFIASFVDSKTVFNISTVNMMQALTKQPTVDNILLEDLQYTILDYNWVVYRDSMELAELHEIDERIPPKEYVAYRPERMTQKKTRSTQKKN